MKIFNLHLGAIALGAALLSSQTVLADCGELCMGTYCRPTPAQQTWGCGMSGPMCFDFQCLPDDDPINPALIEKIEKAVIAGDSNLVALLAASAGHPLRIHTKDGLLYDGFAIAGLESPTAIPASSSSEFRVACRSKSVDSVKPAAAEDDEAVEAATAADAKER